MKRLSLVISAWVVLTALPAWTQEPDDKTAMPEGNVARPNQKLTKTERGDGYPNYPNLSPGELQATPEMWFYQQAMRQYKDPDLAVRRAAEFRAQQRQARIEARKWYGLSNQRPQVSVDPIHTDYSPGWTSNSFYPYRWSANGGPWIATRPEGSRSY